MTPERAEELARELSRKAIGSNTFDAIRDVADVILAACAEERRGALTEAIDKCNEVDKYLAKMENAA